MHDTFAGFDAAREGDHIGMIDQRFPGFAIADDNLQQVLGKAGLDEQFGAEERGQRSQF